MEVVAELVAKLPEMEIDGNMSEGFEAKVWEKRMPGLTPAEQLAVEIDRFIYDHDTALYRDNSQVIGDMESILPHLDDPDMEELSNRVIGKLRNMTDEEFERYSSRGWENWTKTDVKLACKTVFVQFSTSGERPMLLVWRSRTRRCPP